VLIETRKTLATSLKAFFMASPHCLPFDSEAYQGTGIGYDGPVPVDTRGKVVLTFFK
jgi:hypothetical protein